jgi:hypothetical protein
MMRWAGRSAAVFGSVAVLWFIGPSAWAQTASPTGATDCTSFDTTEEAQTFYDDHKDDNPNNPDPYGLDTDGDGTPCEGLRSAGATTTATPAPSGSPSPTASPSGQLTETGAATNVMALSGVSLLELGYALTLLARRWGVRSRQLPVYLLRKLVRARREGHDGIELADELIIVHKSALEEQQDEPVAPEPLVETVPQVKIAGPSVYAQVARDAVERNEHK